MELLAVKLKEVPKRVKAKLSTSSDLMLFLLLFTELGIMHILWGGFLLQVTENPTCRDLNITGMSYLK